MKMNLLLKIVSLIKTEIARETCPGRVVSKLIFKNLVCIVGLMATGCSKLVTLCQTMIS